MPVLTAVEARSLKGKIFQGGVLVALIIGGATMVYPFLLMLSGSTRSEMDASEMALMPDYFVDDDALTRKFLEMKYNHDVAAMNVLRNQRDFSFEHATLPERVVERRIADFEEFVASFDPPDHWWVLGGAEMVKSITSANQRRLSARLRDRYDGDLRALGVDLGSPLRKWRHVSFRIPDWTSDRYDYQPSFYYDEYFDLLEERPLAERAFVSLTGYFMENAVYPIYGKGSTDDYNAVHARPIGSFHEFRLPRRVPPTDQPKLRAEWLEFVFEILNMTFVSVDADPAEYRRYLQGLYGDIATLNDRWGGTTFQSFDEIDIPDEEEWMPAAQRQDFAQFLQALPPERIRLVGPEYRWTDWLKKKYATLEALNAAHEADYPDWAAAAIPMDHLESRHTRQNSWRLRRQFALNNFINVVEEVILQGRPFFNTVTYVCLSLLLCLTLQPLAAYSLSRFNPPGTWRIILIFMATMAFPPMVGMIPQFLILRKVNLLNTYIALVLPVIVNGYLIFLLKGFFDSLPRHLYEAALIDGASELRMFWEITMALSKPILAVVALQTFNHAWVAFMYPLLVCPKEEMHVLAVWLYQFQAQAPTPAVFASILVTSIPTLLIFLFTQRTIMRGIAVPAEK